MIKLITQNDLLETGAYLLNATNKEYLPFVNSNELYLTQESNQGLKLEIIKLISQAQKVLKICSFIITDREVFEAILNKAKEKKVAIFILTQLDQTKIISSQTITDEELNDNSSQSHINCIRELYDQGVHVRAATSAHAKFIISDRKEALLMSANLTSPSLTFNTESGFYLEPKDVSQLEKLFDVIFQNGTTYRKFINAGKKNKQFIVQSEVNIRTEWLPKAIDSNLKYTYETLNNSLYQSIIDIVRGSKEFLLVSSYSIVGLEKLDVLVKEIGAAIKRGVKIDIFCRGMNYRLDHLNGTKQLAALGCRIYGDMFNHSKGIISESRGMIFTANIDGNHGLLNGFEVGYILDAKKRLEFLKFHEYLIEYSLFKYSISPRRVDFYNTYTFYESKKNISSPAFASEIELFISHQLVKSKQDLENYPLYLSRVKEDQYFLIAGNSFYKCMFDAGRIQVIDKAPPAFNIEKHLLKFNNMKIVYN